MSHLVRFPTFQDGLDGKLSCQQFLFVMEQFSDANGWTETELITITAQCLPIDLEDPTEAFPTFGLLKNHMLTNFKPKLTFKERNFLKQSLVQWEGETVIEFYQRCEQVQSQLCDESIVSQLQEKDILMNFIAGLRKEIQEQFLGQIPQNVRQYLQEVIRIESLLSDEKPTSQKPSIKCEEDTKDFFQEFTYRCKTCDMSFQSQTILDEHQNREHKSFECLRCSNTFPTMKQMMDHKRAVHKNEKDFTCNFCGKVYTKKSSFWVHKKTEHSELKWKCDICPNKAFAIESLLKQHVKACHLKEKNHICEDCGGAFATNFALKGHRKLKHNQGEFAIQCHQCDQTFQAKSFLDNHILRIHNKGTYVCDECGKPYDTKHDLKVHKTRTHTEDKGEKIPCPYPDCSKKFYQQSRMKKHVNKIHNEGTKPHACQYCPKRFWEANYLREHTNGVHLNIKPYKCDQCDFASAYSVTLQGHIKASHGGQKFYCPYAGCNHFAKYNGNLTKHINNIHKKHTS